MDLEFLAAYALFFYLPLMTYVNGFAEIPGDPAAWGYFLGVGYLVPPAEGLRYMYVS